ncbi:MAG: hypothetical protein AB8G86_02810 [Saprospiraceae bacterium]
MKILHKKTNEYHEAVIELVEDEDWEVIEKSGDFIFNWSKEKDYLVHKIRLQLEDKILGLISIEDIPKEYRLHIHLVENSNANKGRKKIYDNIAGCLIAHTCEIAFEKNYDGFVSLKPKTEIVELYKNKYGFSEMGQFLFTELNNSESLIKKYLSNE